jgi:ABC-type sugar transport system substrate-binding protein
MNHQRIALAVSVLAVGALALAGCSDGAPTPAASEGSDVKNSVLFVNPLPKYPAWRAIGDCMADAAEARGLEFTESGPTGQAIDPTAMIEQIQQGIANNVGAIITLPASEAFGPLLQQAQEAGIVTETMFGSGTPEGGGDINVGTNFALQGEAFVAAVQELPGDKVVGLIAAGETGVGGSWLEAVKSAAEKTDDVTIVGEVYTGDDSSKALAQTSALLTAHPEITVIGTHMGTVTQGAVSALASAGRSDIKLFAQGKDNGGIEGLEDGTVYGINLADLCAGGQDAVNAVADLLEDPSAASGDDVQEVVINTKIVGIDEAPALIADNWG